MKQHSKITIFKFLLLIFNIFTSKSGSDTDNEIERIQSLKANKKNDSIYDQDTDVENISEDFSNENKIDEFPDIFADMTFYIDKQLNDDVIKLLTQHIVAYNG